MKSLVALIGGRGTPVATALKGIARLIDGTSNQTDLLQFGQYGVDLGDMNGGKRLMLVIDFRKIWSLVLDSSLMEFLHRHTFLGVVREHLQNQITQSLL